MKKETPGGTIILNTSTINENHMMYDSWDMEHDRHIFFSFWTVFALLHPVTTQRIKKHLKISSFYTSVQKNLIKCYTVPEIWHVTYVIVSFHFELFFAILVYFLPFYPPNIPKNQNFKKMKKNLKILTFCKFVPKILISWCTVLEILCATDGWAGGSTDRKSDI